MPIKFVVNCASLSPILGNPRRTMSGMTRATDVPKGPTVRLSGSCGHEFMTLAQDVQLTHVASVVVGYSAVCTRCWRPSLVMASPSEIALLLEAGCGVADGPLPASFEPAVI